MEFFIIITIVAVLLILVNMVSYGNTLNESEENVIEENITDEKGFAYWIFYEDSNDYYCENCIEDRLNEILENEEFSKDINYDAGDTCGYYEGIADEDYEIYCCKCSAPLLSNTDTN